MSFEADQLTALSNLRLNDRQGQLLEQLRRHRTATITALAKELDVSTETVRRDVRWLAAKGLVAKSHGSVAWPDRREDRPLQRRLLVNMPAKQIIAAAVAKEIADGESLLIDTGSTNIYVAEALQGHRNLTAITNSAPIAQRLSQGQGSKVLLAGGEVRADDSAAFGPSTLSFLEQFQADTAVVSAAAINAESGVMDNHLCEAEVCQTLVRRAHRVILAVDHSKFSAQGLVVACKLADIDLMITDSAPPPELARRLEAADVEVQIAG
jgi:DeoR family glycerol-3-phosphate regulon repressor